MRILTGNTDERHFAQALLHHPLEVCAKEAVNQEDIESTLMIGHENITLVLLEMLTSLHLYRQEKDADPKPGPILTRIITPEMTITQHASQNSSYTG